MTIKQQVIVTVPDSTDFNVLPEGLQDILTGMKVEHAHTGWTMPSTRSFNGRRAIYFSTTATHKATEFFVMVLNSAMAVGWQLEAMQDYKLRPIVDLDTEEVTGYDGVYKAVPATFIGYLNDVDDGNGNMVRPTEISGLMCADGADGWVLE